MSQPLARSLPTFNRRDRSASGRDVDHLVSKWLDEQYVEAGDIVLPKPRYSGFSIRRWTAFCAAVEYAIWFSRYRYQRLRRIDATRRLFSGVFGVVLEDATHQAGPEFAQKARCSISKPFLAGSATSKRSASAFFHVLCSYRLRSLTMPKS